MLFETPELAQSGWTRRTGRVPTRDVDRTRSTDDQQSLCELGKPTGGRRESPYSLS